MYSVTNPDTLPGDVLDNQMAFSFYDFLRYSNQNLSHIQYNEAYQVYLRQWSGAKNSTLDQLNNLIRDRYVELLKDISLNHLTYEERRFITAADFNNAEDINIIVPFFSRKLKEICNFYASKREKVKKQIEVVKQKGNKASIESTAYKAVTEYLYATDDDSIQQNYPTIVIEDVLKTAKIEFEELYDLYSSYLDNSPASTYADYNVQTPLRQTEYTANTNAFEADMFLNFDAAVKRYILEHVNIYLREIYGNFTINYNIDAVDLNCKTNDKLYDFISSYKDEATKIVNLKKDLTQKYMGADYYYITTSSTITPVVSGMLFEATAPSKNLLNRHFPTTASVEETSKLQNMRSIGNFFRPEKNGLLWFTVPTNRYKLNTANLFPNSTYIFPDPNLYGNTTGLTNTVDAEYPFTHIADFQNNVNNAACYYAEGDVTINPFNQGFFAYYAKNQLSNNIQTNLPGLSTNLASINNNGRCVQWACDVFGNQYGLFKSSALKPLADYRSTTTAPTTTYEYYDGGVIKYHNGHLLPDPVHADVASWVVPNIFTSNYYYNALFDGGIGNVIQGMMIRPLMANRVYDGLFYDLPPETQYSLILNNENNIFSDGSMVIDGGLYTDSLVYEADFSYTYILSSIQYHEMDGGPIIQYQEVGFVHDAGKNLVINENIDGKHTTLTTLSSSASDHGVVYVKNIVSERVYTSSLALSAITAKYTTDIQQELENSVLDFNVYNDIIYFHTPNYFVVDKVDFDGESIQRKSYTNNYIVINPLSSVANISSPFFFEDREYCLTCVVTAVSAQHNASLLLPMFYRIDYESALMTQLDISGVNVAEVFTNVLPVKFVKISKPILTYNSRNELYAMVCTLFDSNNLSYTYQVLFDYDQSNIILKGVKLVSMSGDTTVETINWHDINHLDMFEQNFVPYAEATININNLQGCITIC